MRSLRKAAKCNYKKLLICLHGGADTGKTSTLLELGDELKKQCTKYIEYREKRYSVDKRMVYHVFDQNIGIGTYGDTALQIDENIGVLDRDGCKIIITAARSKIVRPRIKSRKLANFVTGAAIWNIAKVWQCAGSKKINVVTADALLYFLSTATAKGMTFSDEEKWG